MIQDYSFDLNRMYEETNNLFVNKTFFVTQIQLDSRFEPLLAMKSVTVVLPLINKI